eukprot:CAMPEP_0118928172 /NCGR_PEP_ID=MMETSP1169-20130426/5485_1 /TAXON_ID=36882 /ORGANISM="Pyramimonas obovata, Strain CCMP722" /LENGTH=45 /DNA_ID= /DNA_START= /DNA_END= /DNA_ORIENTATION=
MRAPSVGVKPLLSQLTIGWGGIRCSPDVNTRAPSVCVKPLLSQLT